MEVKKWAQTRITTTFHSGGGSSLTSADNFFICHAEPVSASQKIPPTLTLPLKGGREELVSGAHSKHLFTYSLINLLTSKKAAFTLAEVLITLAIIGIVAAMTIPTLISKYNEKQTVTKLQKVYATLKNAFEMAKVDHGDFETWHWNEIPSSYNSRSHYFWETYIFPHLNVTKKCFPASSNCFTDTMTRPNGETVTVNTDGYGAFILNDGTSVYTWAGGDRFYPHIWVYADLNGKAKPNVIGQDIFVMYFSPNNPGDNVGSYDDDKNFVANKTAKTPSVLHFRGEENGVTLDDLMSSNFILEEETGAKVNMSCPEYGTTCGAAIKLNNWKVPDNYPFKF